MNDVERLTQLIADLKEELDNHQELADDHRKLIKKEITDLELELESLA